MPSPAILVEDAIGQDKFWLCHHCRFLGAGESERLRPTEAFCRKITQHDAVGDLIFPKYGTLWNKDSFWDPYLHTINSRVALGPEKLLKDVCRTPISKVKHFILMLDTIFRAAIVAHLHHCDNIQQSEIYWGCSSSDSCVKSWSNESLEVWWCLEHLQRIWQGRRQRGTVLDSGEIRYAASVYLSYYYHIIIC